jgi:glycosyltransferase involved in cell wall biosynthesis
MNVLMYTKWFFPVPGGVQTVVRDLAAGLSHWQSPDGTRDPIRVVVVTETESTSGMRDSYPFEVIRRPSLLQLIKLIRGADVIHLAGPVALPLMLALALRKSVLVEHHGFQTACPNGLLFLESTQNQCPGHFMARRYRRCFECNRTAVGSAKSLLWLIETPLRRWLSNRARINVTPTAWLAEVLKLNRTVTVPHGVTASASGKFVSSNKIFAFQGRLVTSKGIQVLLSAARRLSAGGQKFRIKIIGDGPELPALRLLAADLGTGIEFLGHVSEEKLEDALSDVGTVIMPSLGGEVFGLVAAENMARGKLVIVSSIGALKEVVGQTGLVFEVGDADELTSHMRRVLESPPLAGSVGSAARIRAADFFCGARMIERHAALYRRLWSARFDGPSG